MSYTETASDNHFHQKAISSLRDAHSNAEIELPIRAEVQVYAGHNLLHLIVQRIRTRFTGPSAP